MKPGGPLKRTVGLRANLDKVREFQRRARENAKAPDRAPLKRSPPKRREKQPDAVLREIEKRSRGRCIVCGARCDVRRDRHHVLPVSRYPKLECVADNQVLACVQCHMSHEAASRRIRYDELPECAIRLAHMTSGAAVLELDRHYPRGC